MISASRSCCFALRTLCSIPARSSSCERYSETSTEIEPDEHRLALLVPLLDVVEDRVVLRVLRLEDEVVLVVARDLHVRRDLDDVQVVDLDELLLLGLRGTGHPGELLVEPEVVLQRDRRERDVLLLDAHALLRLDRLVQALRPTPAFHDAAGELVDDLDLAVLDDVVDVAVVERLRLQRLVEVVDELRVARVVEVVDPERALDRLDRSPASGRSSCASRRTRSPRPKPRPRPSAHPPWSRSPRAGRRCARSRSRPAPPSPARPR